MFSLEYCCVRRFIEAVIFLKKTRILIASRKQRNGYYNIPTLLEHTFSKLSCGRYERLDSDGLDFTDGSECKKCVSNLRKSNGNFLNTFAISKIKNKKGLIRAICYSKRANDFYFFAIPYVAYHKLQRNKEEYIDVIEICIETVKNKEQARGKLNPTGIWAKYRVDSLERLTTITHEEAIQTYYS